MLLLVFNLCWRKEKETEETSSQSSLEVCLPLFSLTKIQFTQMQWSVEFKNNRRKMFNNNIKKSSHAD